MGAQLLPKCDREVKYHQELTATSSFMPPTATSIQELADIIYMEYFFSSIIFQMDQHSIIDQSYYRYY